jgi:hypothetical protein
MRLAAATALGYPCPLRPRLKLALPGAEHHPILVIPAARSGATITTSEPYRKGDVMGKHARIGLLLGASGCLLAVMVDWVIEELNKG